MRDKLVHFIRDDNLHGTVFQSLSFMDRDGIRNLEWHDGSGSVSVIVIIGAFDSVNIKTHDGVFTIRIFKHFQWHESGGGWIYGCI